MSALSSATFGSGCFWCTEAVFAALRGVKSVTSGYTGGAVEHPTYKQVCSGTTGHAEAVQIEFDPETIAYEELLEVFFASHDPTTLNRQGADTGTQYRSVIFYHDDEQRMSAESLKAQLNAENRFGRPVVTEIVPAATFYPAEPGHQNYFALNGSQPYCRVVIRPKLEKVAGLFADKLK